ncbi:MAG: hypothetical protein WBW37_13435 [Methyloceanibacter sp.]
MSRLVITRRSLLTTSSASAGLFLIAGGAQLLRTEPNPFKVTMTTLFWVGEPSTDENDFIPNDQSYWDKDWQANYGGVDDPERRNGHWPADFTPKQNPFYVALPFGEFTEQNELKKDARRVPWYRSGLDPLLKNRWVEINRDGRSCFAQWQDVGPCGEDDFGFVFGKADKPLNTFDARAGLDVSPAVWHYLGMQDNCHAGWRFVDAGAVPAGPWTDIVTTLGNNR